jgi:hypothetical protein
MFENKTNIIVELKCPFKRLLKLYITPKKSAIKKICNFSLISPNRIIKIKIEIKKMIFFKETTKSLTANKLIDVKKVKTIK